MADRLVVGVGNRVRGDDAIGPEVVDRIAAMGLAGVEARIAEPLDLVDLLADRELVVVVDASAPAGTPGRVRRHQLGAELEPGRGGSTHGVGVAEAIELAAAFGALPDQLVVVSIEAADVAVRPGLSSPVRAAVETAVAEVLDVLGVGDLGPEAGRPRPLPRPTLA